MRKPFDFLTLFFIVAIGSFSLLTLFAVNRSLYNNQLLFWVLGLGAFYIALNTDHKSLIKIAVPFYVLTVVLLTILFWIAEPVRGSIRWIDLGPFRLQPSELAKLSLILLLPSFFQNRSAKEIKNVIASFIIAIVPAFLTFKQPDLGNALSIMAIWFGITLIAGFRVKHLLILTLAAVIFFGLGFELLSTYQKNRIESFLNPGTDPLGTGYNILQSKIAIGSGGVFGRGLGRGSQSQLNFLPESESDFIFASISEQFGMFGAGVLISLYALLVIRIAGFAKNADRLSVLIVTGAVSFLTFQFMVNVGMNLSLMPVTGITFPLVSYGGSSLLTTLALLGIAFSINRNQMLDF